MQALAQSLGIGRTGSTSWLCSGFRGLEVKPGSSLLTASPDSRESLEASAITALEAAFGPGKWLEGRAGSALYLNRDLIAESHGDGRGCGFHEQMEVLFEKQSIGVLTDEQFKKFKGRDRNETEGLRYENYLLKKEVQRMKKEIEALKAEMKALAAAQN